MYAVIKTGGKQYRVAAGDVIEVERLGGDVGQTVAFDQVLMVGGQDGEGGALIGTPLLEGAKVTAEVLEHSRGPKIIVFKKNRRKHYRRKRGHRQLQTVLRVRGIALD
jgi:large subunit ribosomal protein L21